MLSLRENKILLNYSDLLINAHDTLCKLSQLQLIGTEPTRYENHRRGNYSLK